MLRDNSGPAVCHQEIPEVVIWSGEALSLWRCGDSLGDNQATIDFCGAKEGEI